MFSKLIHWFPPHYTPLFPPLTLRPSARKRKTNSRRPNSTASSVSSLCWSSLSPTPSWLLWCSFPLCLATGASPSTPPTEGTTGTITPTPTPGARAGPAQRTCTSYTVTSPSPSYAHTSECRLTLADLWQKPHHFLIFWALTLSNILFVVKCNFK